MTLADDIVARANSLARRFYKLMGCDVAASYRFDRATHPQERLCWGLAVAAFEYIENTDVDDALAETTDEP